MDDRPRVGNDVVDLDDPHIVTSHLRARFLERVCNDDERAAVVDAPNPKTLLWSFFAAKEAAYKVVVKLGPPPPLAHRRFVVARDLTSVRYGPMCLRLKVEQARGHVHAVAFTGETPLVVLEHVPPEEDLSVHVRRLLCKTVSDRKACRPEDIAVVRDLAPGSWSGFGPPYVTVKGERLDADVSLSHDGRFVACALTR